MLQLHLGRYHRLFDTLRYQNCVQSLILDTCVACGATWPTAAAISCYFGVIILSSWNLLPMAMTTEYDVICVLSHGGPN